MGAPIDLEARQHGVDASERPLLRRPRAERRVEPEAPAAPDHVAVDRGATLAGLDPRRLRWGVEAGEGLRKGYFRAERRVRNHDRRGPRHRPLPLRDLSMPAGRQFERDAHAFQRATVTARGREQNDPETRDQSSHHPNTAAARAWVPFRNTLKRWPHSPARSSKSISSAANSFPARRSRFASTRPSRRTRPGRWPACSSSSSRSTAYKSKRRLSSSATTPFPL